MNLKPLLIVSHDAGGANLLARWCKSWQSKIQFLYMLSGPALDIFRSFGLVSENLKQYPDVSTIRAVITSTGWQTDLEYAAVVWARKHGIHVSSYLDHWVHYKERFIRSNHEVLPDEIWVADLDAKAVALKSFKSKKIKIRYIRNRYYSELKRKITVIDTSKNNILICLEPIRNGIEYEEVYNNLTKYLADSNYRNMIVVIRDHPSDTNTGLLLLIEKLSVYFNVKISENELWEDLSEAEIVIGYQSSILVYASYLNMPAISYFPAYKLEPILPHKVIEYI